MEGGEIAEKAESTYTMQPVHKLCPEEMESHTREYADLPERHVDSQFTRRTGTNLSQVVIILPQGRKRIKYKWVLWDACSFKSVSKNPKMMRDIKECNGNDLLTFFKNGGPKTFYHEAYLNLLPLKVHYNKEYMATILVFMYVANITRSLINNDTVK